LNDLTLGGVSILGGTSGLGYSTSTTNKLTGQNSTDRSNAITAVMTATVVDILPNGNMVIRGSRWTKVNEEYQQMVLEGVVRPADITRSNTVLSQNIADARIFMSGKGPLTTASKAGWFAQFLNLFNPL
jgi:flagellar L-ring protein precursor FlgH